MVVVVMVKSRQMEWRMEERRMELSHMINRMENVLMDYIKYKTDINVVMSLMMS